MGHSLRQKIFLAVSTLIILMFFVMGVMIYRIVIEDQKMHVYELGAHVVKAVAFNFDRALQDLKRDIRRFHELSSQSMVMRQTLKNFFVTIPHVEALRILEDGQATVSISRSANLPKLSNGLSASNELQAFSFFFLDPRTDDRYFQLYFRGGISDAVIETLISKEFMKAVVSAGAVPTEAIYVFSGAGELFYHLPEKNVLSSADLQKMIAQKSTVAGLCTVEPAGKMLCASTPLSGTNLSIGVLVPYREAFDSAKRILLGSIWQLLGVIMIAIGGAYLLVRHITRPLFELIAATKEISGGKFDLQLNFKPREDELGRLILAFREMAAKLLAREKEVEAANLKLYQSGRLAAMGQLSAGIAHEVKNPLTSVLGFAKILKTASNLQGDQKEAVDIILRETQRCTEILQGLLSFARQDETRFSLVNLREVLENVVKLVRHEFQKKGIQITIDGKGADAVVHGNKSQLQQVFLNIFLNALDYSPQGGHVKVCAELDSGGKVRIAISDEGSGISEEGLGRLFEPFYTTKASGKGTGLGLSMSYGIIQNHGGKIEVANNAAKGATFTVILDLNREQS